MVLLATSQTAQELACGLPDGTRRIADRGPVVPCQLTDGEPLQVVHDNPLRLRDPFSVAPCDRQGQAPRATHRSPADRENKATVVAPLRGGRTRVANERIAATQGDHWATIATLDQHPG
jgi:hypothetical protein